MWRVILSTLGISLLAIGSLSSVYAVCQNCNSSAQIKVQQSIQNLQQTKVKISTTLVAEREKYLETREEVKTQIEERKQQVLERVRERLMNHIDRVIAHLEYLKTRIADNQGLGESQKETAMADIDYLINQLTNLSLREEVSSAETIEGVKSIGSQIRSVWQETQAIRKKMVGFIIAGRFSNFLDRLVGLADKLETHLNDLTEKNVDVGKSPQKLDNFKEAIVEARYKITQAITIFESINKQTRSDGTFQQGMNLLREAKQQLHEAGKALRDAIQEAKNAVDHE